METSAQKKPNLRVCVVSPLYNPNLGGVGRQAIALTEFLSRSGVEVFVICRHMQGMPDNQFINGVLIKKIHALNPHKHDLEEKTFGNLLISLSFCAGLILKLIKYRKNYDLVHFHGASLPLIFSVAPLKIMKKRIIAKVAGAKMGIEAGSFRGKYFFWGDLFIRILKKVDAYIAISTEIRNDLVMDGFDRQKIFQITNFVIKEDFHPEDDIEKLREIKERLGLESDRRVITFSGRLVRRKRVDVLIKAFADVLRRRDDVQLVILGHGELMGDMESLSDSLGIRERVYFMGFVPNMLDYLQVTDIFVFPSDQEGMPNSLLEAMACRIPVVATRIGGTSDVIRDGVNGLLVNPGDAGELARSIMTVLGDACLAAGMAEKALRTIREGYSLDATASKYIELYRKILHGA